MGAIIANESGGREGAKRFEPKVYGHLARVQVGLETHYGSLKRADLRNLGDEALRDLATSWGQPRSWAITRLPTELIFLRWRLPG